MTGSVLSLSVEGIAPAAGSSTFWDLSFSGVLQGSGQPVESILSVDGLRVEPTTVPLRIEVHGIAAVPEPSVTTLVGIGLAGLFATRRRKS